MNSKKYSSAIKKTAFKYPVSKNVALLMVKGADWNEINQECFENNLIGIDSLPRRREVLNVIYRRLSSLDDYLLTQFCDGDIETSKFILVYAIAKTDLLFYEFLHEVYRDALLNIDKYISPDDIDNFLNNKKENDPEIALWSNDTIECLVTGYKNILADSGFGTRDKRLIKVAPVMIHPDVHEHIELLGDKDYLQIMLGED